VPDTKEPINIAPYLADIFLLVISIQIAIFKKKMLATLAMHWIQSPAFEFLPCGLSVTTSRRKQSQTNRIFASSLFIRFSSSSLARAFLKSAINCTKPNPYSSAASSGTVANRKVRTAHRRHLGGGSTSRRQSMGKWG